MICKICSLDKPISNFRNSRKTCKCCENKIRYQRKKDSLSNDPQYKDKENRYMAERQKRRRDIPEFKAKEKIRCLIRKTFSRKKYSKNSKTEQILGASYDVVIAHIESLFVDGMSWRNRYDWHIDHIIPVSSAKNYDEFIILNNYKNLQPLWAKDNLKKGGVSLDK